MPRLPGLRETLDTTFTWTIGCEPGMPEVSLFGGAFPPQPIAACWGFEEKYGGGRFLNEATMALADLSISRADVAVDLAIGNGMASRYSGPWMAGALKLTSVKAPIVPVRQGLFAKLVPLHKLVNGVCLVHLRVIFSRG